MTGSSLRISSWPPTCSSREARRDRRLGVRHLGRGWPRERSARTRWRRTSLRRRSTRTGMPRPCGCWPARVSRRPGRTGRPGAGAGAQPPVAVGGACGGGVSRFVALLVAFAVVGGCGAPAGHAPTADRDTHFYYDASGRLAAVRQGGTTAVYRFDEAGNRVAVEHRAVVPCGARSGHAVSPSPRVSGVSPRLVGQGAVVAISGSGFDTDPMGNVVAVGGAIGRVVAASPRLLRVQLPPVAVPGPVTVSTAYGRSTSKESLVVVPAEVDPADVHDVVATSIDKAVSLHSGPTLLTFRGKAGSTVELHLDSADSSTAGCDVTDVGLAGPTGTIIEADAGGESWCDRPARLPMTGTYTALVSNVGAVRATIRSSGAEPEIDPTRRPLAPASAAPASAGPPGFAVDLASGLMDTAVTDLALGGSGAVDLTRSFSVGDPALPTTAPEEPLAPPLESRGIDGARAEHVLQLPRPRDAGRATVAVQARDVRGRPRRRVLPSSRRRASAQDRSPDLASPTPGRAGS